MRGAGARSSPAANPKSCHERALGLLAVRARSGRELEQRLLQAGFEAEEVRGVLNRLEQAGLVDDREFARQVAEHAFGVKRSGRRGVTSALAAKGVAPDVIAEILEDVGGDDDVRAEELARERAARMRSIDPAKAFSRLTSMLVRRGHSPDAARRAARRALDVAPDDPGLASGPRQP